MDNISQLCPQMDRINLAFYEPDYPLFFTREITDLSLSRLVSEYSVKVREQMSSSGDKAAKNTGYNGPAIETPILDYGTPKEDPSRKNYKGTVDKRITEAISMQDKGFIESLTCRTTNGVIDELCHEYEEILVDIDDRNDLNRNSVKHQSDVKNENLPKITPSRNRLSSFPSPDGNTFHSTFSSPLDCAFTETIQSENISRPQEHSEEIVHPINDHPSRYPGWRSQMVPSSSSSRSRHEDEVDSSPSSELACRNPHTNVREQIIEEDDEEDDRVTRRHRSPVTITVKTKIHRRRALDPHSPLSPHLCFKQKIHIQL